MDFENFLPKIANGISFQMMPKLEIACFIDISKYFLATRARCVVCVCVHGQPKSLLTFWKDGLACLWPFRFFSLGGACKAGRQAGGKN